MIRTFVFRLVSMMSLGLIGLASELGAQRMLVDTLRVHGAIPLTGMSKGPNGSHRCSYDDGTRTWLAGGVKGCSDSLRWIGFTIRATQNLDPARPNFVPLMAADGDWREWGVVPIVEFARQAILPSDWQGRMCPYDDGSMTWFVWVQDACVISLEWVSDWVLLAMRHGDYTGNTNGMPTSQTQQDSARAHLHAFLQEQDSLQGLLRSATAAKQRGDSQRAQAAAANSTEQQRDRAKPKPTALGIFKSEVTTGMTKQCFYDVLGSLHTVTQPLVSLCSLTATFPVP